MAGIDERNEFLFHDRRGGCRDPPPEKMDEEVGNLFKNEDGGAYDQGKDGQGEGHEGRKTNGVIDRQNFGESLPENKDRRRRNGYGDPFPRRPEKGQKKGRGDDGDGDVHRLVSNENGDKKPPRAGQEAADEGREGTPVLFHLVQMQGGQEKKRRLRTGEETGQKKEGKKDDEFEGDRKIQRLSNRTANIHVPGGRPYPRYPGVPARCRTSICNYLHRVEMSTWNQGR